MSSLCEPKEHLTFFHIAYILCCIVHSASVETVQPVLWTLCWLLLPANDAPVFCLVGIINWLYIVTVVHTFWHCGPSVWDALCEDIRLEWDSADLPGNCRKHRVAWLLSLVGFYYHPWSGVCNSFGRVCLYVCLSDNNFRKPWRRKFIFSHVMYLHGSQARGPHYTTIMRPLLKLPPNMAADSLR